MQQRTVGRAPGRVNLIGEHTDYNGGLCLPIALGIATYAECRPRDDDSLTVTSAQVAQPWAGPLTTVTGMSSGPHPAWVSYVLGVLWALHEDGLDVPGLDVRIDSEVPIGAGLSSSAALECAVATGVAALLELRLSTAVRRRLAAACIRAETEFVGAPTGGMDQTVTMLAEPGHALLIDFGQDSLTPVPLPLEEAGLALVVTDTRVAHDHASGGYAARRAECAAGDRRRLRHVTSENQRVRDAVTSIGAGAWPDLGELMTASHVSLRDDFEVSCPELDLAVESALQAGALGARLTGGGFGGSIISLVPEQEAPALTSAVDTAFRAAGLAAPNHLRARPSGHATARRP